MTDTFRGRKRKWCRNLAFAALAVQFSGCEFIIEPGGFQSGCTTWTGPLFQQNVSFLLNVQDPSVCPVGAESGQMVTTGAIVRDLTAQWPSDLGNSLHLSLKVSGSADVQINETFNSCTLPTLSPTVFESFNWGMPLASDPFQRYMEAQGFVSYTVYDNPDYMCLDVQLRDTIAIARGRVNINYFGTQFRPTGTGLNQE